MAGEVEFSLSFEVNHIEEFLTRMGEAVDRGLDTWAGETVLEADGNAPTDTGGMRASRYRITPITNEFANAVAAFNSANPTGDASSEPAVAVSEHEAAIGFAAGYARFVNDGHHAPSGVFVPAQPFFTSATEAHLPLLSDKVSAEVDKVNL